MELDPLYEVVPVAAPAASRVSVDPLKYQASQPSPTATNSQELLTVKLRYQEPAGSASQLLTLPVRSVRFDEPIVHASDNLRWAAAVAQFGLLLCARKSPYAGTATWVSTAALAQSSAAPDPDSARTEFRTLAQQAMVVD